jgi:hypothetical protein
MTKAVFMVFLFLSLFFQVPAFAGIDNALYDELKDCGRLDNNEIFDYFGVPCVKVGFYDGESIMSFCRLIKRLNDQYYKYRAMIAFFNQTDYGYIVGSKMPYGAVRKSYAIPLDIDARPKIFCEYEKEFSAYGQYLVIDKGKNYAGLYENGHLVKTFPMSPGTSEKTPLMKFVARKYRNAAAVGYESYRWSNKFEVWMPYAFQLAGNIFMHAGVLPGQPDSHGCVRFFMPDAEYIWNWADDRLPGKIIDSKKAH